MAIKSANQSGLGGNEVTLLKSQGVMATGGSVICLNGHMLHKFTGTSTFNALQPLNVEFLIVGGGGSAGSALYHSGGGGGGGFIQGSMYIPAGTYTVTVGAGGANPGSNTLKGNNGSNSSFNGIIAYGGGGGGVYACGAGRDGANGGGGGAQAGVVGLGGIGCLGQGYIGGCYNGADSGAKTGGGGAGAFSDGGIGRGDNTGGNGGNGMPSFISNTLTYYGGGGGGSTETTFKTVGGIGGGGQGNCLFGQDGTANSGGGGGGGERISPAIGGSGGSGIVYIKYKTNSSTGPTGQIVTNCLVYYADTDNRVSYPGLVNIVGAKISSTFGNTSGAWRASCYSVQYSSDNTNWATAFSGIMSNNGNYGVQTGTSNLTIPVGPYRYWRYVEGTAICNHHPRVSRVMLTDFNGNDYVICKYTNDNVSDAGEYQIGTITRDFCSIWHDMSGCSNTAPLINTPSYSLANGGTFYFNGANNYVPVGCYNQPSSAMTLDVWLTANDTTQLRSILSKWGAGAASNYSWLFFTNWFGQGNVYFLLSSNGNGYESVAMAHCLQTGKWINYTVTFNAGAVRMYRNGQLAISTTASTTSLRNPSTCLTIGADWDGGSSDSITRHWGGCIASVKVYGTALSQNDVLQNFNALRGRFCV